jgi:hypothetical protein
MKLAYSLLNFHKAVTIIISESEANFCAHTQDVCMNKLHPKYVTS